MKNVCVREENLFLDIAPEHNAENCVHKIKNLIYNMNSKNIFINLCGLNMFDAIKISSLISAYGLADNASRKFNITADNKIVAGHIKLFGLSNMQVKLQEEKEKSLAAF